MAHYALLNALNIVVRVFVGRDEDDLAPGVDDWEIYYAPENHTVKRTSYNTYGGVHYDPETGEPSEDQSKAFRKNYAGIGWQYDAERDAFIEPQPFLSWSLNEETCQWDPPTPKPARNYWWSEETLSWVEIPPPYESWTWNNETREWVAPVPMPEDGQAYVWDETAGEWVVSE